MALVLSAVPEMLVDRALAASDPSDTTMSEYVGELTTIVIALAAGMFLTTLTLGVMVLAGVGRTRPAPPCRGRALPSLLVLGVLIGCVVTLGFLLLSAPGFMLHAVWCVSAPALAAEGLGVRGALARSRALTEGARWPIFALFAAMTAGWIVISLMQEQAGITMLGGEDAFYAARMAGALPNLYVIPALLAQTAAAVVWSAVQIALYVELRERRDGPDADALREVFA